MHGRLPDRSTLAPAWCLALALATGAFAAPLIASDFTDFRIPDHRWYTLSANVNASGNRQFSSVASNRVRAWNAGGGLSFNGSWTRENDRGTTAFWGSGSASGGRNVRDTKSTNTSWYHAGEIEDRVEHEDQRSAGERCSFGTEVVGHWLPVPLVVRLRGQADVGYSQSWSSPAFDQTLTDSTMRSRSVQRVTSSIWSYSQRYEGAASVGWGRVRNATGVFDAALLEYRLRKQGVLDRPLSNGARRRLAALYYVRPAYAIPHERPDRFFWREIERILRDDGVLDRGWQAFDVFRVDEGYIVPTSKSLVLRRVGYYFGPSIAARADRRTSRGSASFERVVFFDDSLGLESHWERRFNDRSVMDQALAGAEAEIHLPLGLRWQIDVTSRALFEPRDHAKSYELQSNASAIWFMADRWSLDAYFQHLRTVSRLGYAGRASRWNARYGVSLGFYAEDRVRLGLDLDESQGGDRYASSSFGRNMSVVLGVTYRFLGALDAPRLIEPVRSLSASGAELGW